jgi:hypothetical protein
MSWLSLFTRVRGARTRRSPKPRPSFRPEPEALEERFLLNAQFKVPPVDYLNGKAPIVTMLPTLTPQMVSTVPGNGDVNPYGIAEVPSNFEGHGLLKPGDLLISNFNNSQNLQGTGTTIDLITPSGQKSVFFQGQPGLGLDAALGILKEGFVIVGNLPTTDGTMNTVQQGSLLILDANGHVVATLADRNLLDGPWDLTINDQGDRAQVFVSNVLSGTVTRIDLRIEDGKPVVEDMVQIGSGYGHRLDPAALVVGPAGLAYDPRTDTLYVASSADNEIFAIHHAGRTFTDQGKGTLVYQDNVHLHGPLGLSFLPNGDLITANSDAQNVDPNQPSELVEFTRTGKFVGEFSLDPNNGGAFNVAVFSRGGHTYLAAVDDNTNTLDVWTLPRQRGTVPSGLGATGSFQGMDTDAYLWCDYGFHGHKHHE